MHTDSSPVVVDVHGGSEEPLPARCLDCGSERLGPYCHVCGQAATSRIVPLRQLVATAVEDTIGIESRLARTFRLLFTRPGAATLEFLAGRRSRYVPPFRLYLIASLVYFAALVLSGSTRFFFFQASGDPEGFGQFVRLLPRLMFLLLPTFALLLHGVYRTRHRLYAEHVVFALHFHAAAFLILSIEAAVYPLLRAGEAGGITPVVFVASAAAGIAQLWVIVHLYLALRRVYGGSRFATIVRSFSLMFGYGLLLSVAGVLFIPWLRAMVWAQLTGWQ